MAMPALPLYVTAEMVRALPDDGNRYEVVHGELLVSPAPRWLHQRVLSRIHLALAKYLERFAVGEVLASPADISWSADVLVQPDLFVVPAEEATGRSWSDIRHLLLVVEVLSPSNPGWDRFQKRRLYQEVGVPCYWIVDADAESVEVWTPHAAFPILEREALSWHPEGAGAPFSLRLTDLFAGGQAGAPGQR
jgi:Uma2 family endonuclease